MMTMEMMITTYCLVCKYTIGPARGVSETMSLGKVIR